MPIDPFWIPREFVQFSRIFPVSPEVCSSLGVAYHDAGQPEEALEQHQEALKLRASVGSYWWMTIMGT